MEKKSLYGIETEYMELLNFIEEHDGEVTPSINPLLAINRNDLQKKSEGYVAVLNKLSAETDYIDAEVKRLQAAKKVRDNVKERLKNAIADAMTLFDLDEIKTHLNKINFRKSESVIIDVQPEELTKELQKIKIEAISKTEIKKMIKEGKEFKGVRLVENRNLQIK
jgi:hypothetical protein